MSFFKLVIWTTRNIVLNTGGVVFEVVVRCRIVEPGCRAFHDANHTPFSSRDCYGYGTDFLPALIDNRYLD